MPMAFNISVEQLLPANKTLDFIFKIVSGVLGYPHGPESHVLKNKSTPVLWLYRIS